MKFLKLSLSTILLAATCTISSAQLLNGDFEKKTKNFPDNWGLTHKKLGISVVSTPVFSGSTSMKISDSWMGVDGNTGLRSDKITNVSVDSNYLAKAMFYVIDNPGFLFLEFWNSKDERLAEFNVETSSSGKWETVSIKGIMPKTATYATVLIFSNSDNTGVFYADSVTFQKEIVLSAPAIVEEPTLNIYPNPSSGLIHISTNTKYSMVSISDLKGKVVLRSNDSEPTLDASILDDGIYLVKVTTPKGVLCKRLIIQPFTR
jgi:hypothetical protein